MQLVPFNLRAIGNKIDAKNYLKGDGLIQESAAAIQALADAVNSHSADRVSLVFPPQRRFLWPDKPLIITRGGVTVELDDAVLDGSQTGLATSAYGMIQWTPPLGTQFTTKVMGDVARRQEAIPVEDASGLSIGDWLLMLSTEYHSGVDGVPGYRVKYKGEINQIKYKVGNTIYFDFGAKDDYQFAGNTITIKKLNMVEGGAANGSGRAYGIARSQEFIGGDVVPQVAMAIQMERVVGSRISIGLLSDFPRFASTTSLCVDVKVFGTEFVGRNLQSLSNAGIAQSERFTGHYFNACDTFSFVGNIGRGLRRPADADVTNSGQPVARNYTCAGNVSENCLYMQGTHTVENATFTGNTGINCGAGYVFRGKHATFTGGRCDGLNSNAFRLGIARDNTYALPTSVGNITITGFQSRGGTNAVLVDADCETLKINGNTFDELSASGIQVNGQRSGDIDIVGNSVDLSKRTVSDSSLASCVAIRNSRVGRRSLGAVRIIGNNLRNGWAGVNIEGVADASMPADNIMIDKNIFEGNLQADIALYSLKSTDRGWFGSEIDLGENMHNTMPARGYVLLDSGFRFRRQPQLSAGTSQKTFVRPSYIGPTLPNVAGSTFEPGQYSQTSPINPNLFDRYVCTVGGTVGNLAEAGSITAGQNVLLVSSSAAIGMGTYLKIAGAGAGNGDLVGRVIALGDGTVTLDTPAVVSVVSAPVTYRNPSWAGVGQVRVNTTPVSNEEVDAVVGLMLRQPSDAQIRRMDKFVSALKSGGVWSKLVGLYDFALAETDQAALLNWKSSTYLLSKVGVINWTARVGFAGDGQTGLLNTGFSPGSATSGVLQNDVHLSVISATDGGFTPFDIGTQTLAISCRSAGGSFATRCSNGGSITSPIASGIGSYLASRSQADSYERYKNGLAQASGVRASEALTTQPLYICGRNTTSAGVEYSTRTILGASFGRGLTPAEVAVFESAKAEYYSSGGITIY